MPLRCGEQVQRAISPRSGVPSRKRGARATDEPSAREAALHRASGEQTKNKSNFLSDPAATTPNLCSMRWSPAKTDPKILDELIWAEVARAYRAGTPASALCRKFGFGSSTFHARAKAGGWQRKQAAAEPVAASADVLGGLALGEDTLEQDVAQLARKALALVAAGDGKRADAALKAADRLVRIKRRLGSEAEETEEAGPAQKRAHLLAMSDGELEAEILRLAGM